MGSAIRRAGVVERHRRDWARRVEVAAGRWRRQSRLAPLVASRVKRAAIVGGVMAAGRKRRGEGVESESPAQGEGVCCSFDDAVRREVVREWPSDFECCRLGTRLRAPPKSQSQSFSARLEMHA